MTVTFGGNPRIIGRFVYKKPSKIRWRRSATLEAPIIESLFVSGTWDGGSVSI